MKINLIKKPQSPIIIEGFPGFGLVAPITTEFLLQHLKTEFIGDFEYNELPATTAIHEGKLINPMAIYYSKEHNIVILHTILNVKGFEWEVAEEIAKLAKELNAKEILCIEGVKSMNPAKEQVFFYGNKRLEKCGAKEIKESVIIGVTAALLKKIPNISCLFAESMLDLPDSKAAAEIIKVLDAYLGLKVDYTPLLKQAKMFETKIKKIITNSMKTEEESEKKSLSYLG